MCLSTEKVFHVVMCADSDIFWQRVDERYVKRLNNQEALIIHEVNFSSFFFSILKLILYLKYIQHVRVEDLHRWSTTDHIGEVFLGFIYVYTQFINLGKETLAKWNETIWGFTPPFFILEKPAKCVFPTNSQKKYVSEITWWMVCRYKRV